MRREISEKLMQWKNNARRKPLIVTGVRQCGKTYIIKKFAESHFDNIAYINFEKQPNIESLFEADLDPARIIRDLSNLYLDKQIEHGKTLLFFDEIQIAPKAISSLKYFNEELPSLHVIAAGSLLGVSIRQNKTSYPVGKVDKLELRPMNFKEFLWASFGEKIDVSLSDIDFKNPLPSILYDKLKKALLDYYIVGGMPEAVQAFIDGKGYETVNEIQDNILDGYAGDFAKHAPLKDVPNIELIWQSIPTQLAEENNKFIFSRAKKSARAKDLESSIQWLVDAGLIHVLKKVEHTELPISAFADNSYYKIYLADIGLLTRRARLSYRAILNEGENLKTFKGALTENFVLTELLSLGYNPYYWRSGNTAELDFIIENFEDIVPIEAKANLNTQAKSYSFYTKKFSPKYGFKFSLKNCGFNEVNSTKTFSLPLFLVNKLKDVLNK